MPASETHETLSSRVTLLGGEMLNWSDLEQGRQQGHGPFASPLVVPMLSQLLDRSTTALVTGPTAPWLLERFADRVGSLDVLVRSWPDARTLNLRLNGAPVRVFCGGFERFKQPAGHYDVVLALDGIPRLFSADSADMPWLDALRALRDLVRPGGRLVLGVTNGIGLDAILDADSSVQPPPDDEWPTDSQAAAEPPAGLDAVRATLTGAGLSIDEHYAVYPQATRTSLMVNRRILADHTGDEVLSVVASAAFAQEVAARPVLTDPRRMAREVMRHGVGLDLAPGWLFVTTVDGAAADVPSAEPARAGAVGFPDLLTTDNLDFPYWAVVAELTRDADGQWHRSVVDVGRSASNRASGYLQREPARLATPVPSGVLLEERFLTACRHDDLMGLRRLVRSYAQWLHDQAELKPWADPWSSGRATGEQRLVVPGEAVFATFENVMDDGKRLAILDASWSTTLEMPYEIALARALRRFGYRLLAGGMRHPWPSGMSPNRLTVTLAAMVGVTVTPHLLERSARLEVELEGQRRNNTESDDQQLYFELQTMGEQPMGTEPGQPRGYREALATVGRLSTELAEAQSQIEWLDKTVQLREDQLRRERKTTEHIKNSVSFAIGRAVTTPFRVLFRAVRPVLRAMNPGGR